MIPSNYPNPGAPYRVYWDCADWQNFSTFAEALEFYRRLLKTNAVAPYVMNYDRADDSDPGLTPQESEWVEAVDAGEMP